jgi:hypothetical protein
MHSPPPHKEPETKTHYDVNSIKHMVQLIQKHICALELNGISKPFDYEMSIMETYPEFYQSNPFLVKKLCKKDDLSTLFKMFENLELVEQGSKSLASVELNLGQQLANQYLYPHLKK